MWKYEKKLQYPINIKNVNPKNGGVLAMAFVDMQPLDSVYSEELAFCSGTLFPNLDMPFFGGKNK